MVFFNKGENCGDMTPVLETLFPLYSRDGVWCSSIRWRTGNMTPVLTTLFPLYSRDLVWCSSIRGRTVVI